MVYLGKRTSNTKISTNSRTSSHTSFGTRRLSNPLDAENTKNPSITSITDFEEITENSGNFRKFTKEPKKIPKAVCFELLNESVTPYDVLKQCLKWVEEDKLTGIQFENINCIISTSCEGNKKKNRYIIICEDIKTRNTLVNKELVFHEKDPNNSHKLRIYDIAIMEEYKAFLRITKQTDKLQSIILSGGPSLVNI